MEGPGPGSPVRLRAGTAGRCQSTVHRQASIPHESPVDRTGKKHEGGPRPSGGGSWQPLRCLSPPWAGGGRGGWAARWEAGGMEEGSVPGRGVCVWRHVCV